MGWLQHSLPKAFLMRTRRLLLAVYTYLSYYNPPFVLVREWTGSERDMVVALWREYYIYEDED